jgi:hypothetical protein
MKILREWHAAKWGSQSWLPPPFSRRLDTLESVSAGTIACPTRTPALCHVKEHSYESP